MNLRPATMEDARLLWEWRNDPLVRANSFNHDEVSWGDHVHWLKTVESWREYHRVYIAEVGGVPVGQARFDVCFGEAREEPGEDRKERLEHTAKVSYSIAAEHRGKGYAAEMLRLSVPLALKEMRIWHVRAEVRPDNAASLRALKAAGFEEPPVILEWPAS